MAIPIVDSHVHLWTEAQLQTLAWHSSSNPLGAQYSVEQYLSSVDDIAQNQNHNTTSSSSPREYVLKGFVYLEVDRISSVDEENSDKGWTHVLDEVSFLARIARGTPLQGEGHAESHKNILLGMVPWAPVPGGPVVLERYISLVKERIASSDTGKNEDKTEEIWRKISGVRYLVQDKPAETMLQPDFVEGLKWLGKHGLSFDLGVDARQGGLSQLREAVELIERVYDGVDEKDRVTLIINHLCKPNLHIPPNATGADPEFLEWKDLITTMATKSNTTYMKLSGLLSEFSPLQEYIKAVGGDESETEENDVIDYIVSHVRPWTDVAFDVFGPRRIMFGSDWPVCTVGNGAALSKEAKTGAWRRWKAVVERILDTRGLNEDEMRSVWGGVAVKAYGLQLT